MNPVGELNRLVRAMYANLWVMLLSRGELDLTEVMECHCFGVTENWCFFRPLLLRLVSLDLECDPAVQLFCNWFLSCCFARERQYRTQFNSCVPGPKLAPALSTFVKASLMNMTTTTLPLLINTMIGKHRYLKSTFASHSHISAAQCYDHTFNQAFEMPPCLKTRVRHWLHSALGLESRCRSPRDITEILRIQDRSHQTNYESLDPWDLMNVVFLCVDRQ